MSCISAGVAELADARDLKSRETRVSYRFKPGHRHQISQNRKLNIAEWSSLAARWAHNPKVIGSNPFSATNIANRKRYRCQKPRNHSSFGVFRTIFQSETQKISFPEKDLWGGLELLTLIKT